MLLSDRLRWLRNRYGYSQATIAEKLSLSRMAYTQYESGHREPGLDTLLRIAQVYNVSLDFLLGVSDLSRVPTFSPQEKHLISQLDRLAEDQRQHVFRILQQELGYQMLSDSFITHEAPAAGLRQDSTPWDSTHRPHS